jgi:O-antigen/teichoic acid export membrane protein
MNLNKILNGKHGQSFVGQIVSAGIAVLSFMVLARSFSKIDFGQWILYLSLLTFFDMIKAGMVQSAFIKYASGSSGKGFNRLQGSSWFLNIVVTSLVSCVCLIIYFLDFFEAPGIVNFVLFYPLYGFVSMPFQYFLWNSQIKLKFNYLAFGRIVNVSLFLLVSIFSVFFEVSIQELVIFHLLVFVICSVVALIIKGTGVRNIVLADVPTIKKYWNFGRYHSLAFLGSNLLKSSDTFIIGGLLGPIYIAIYAIPLRLVEIIELPLRASTSVAFPVFSNHDNNKDRISLKTTLEKYLGVLTLLYIPFMTVLFIFSDYLVLLIGGEKYADTGVIFRLFVIYGLFLPFDRFTGVVLDAMGYPRLNFYKVALMASVNIIGDVIVLYFFRSIEMVALVTIVNVLFGAIVGFYLVKKKLNITVLSIYSLGLASIKQSINHFKFL